MQKLRLPALVGLLALGACSPSVNPQLKSGIDEKVLSFPQNGDGVYEPPAAPEPMPVSVGQWARYKLTDDEGKPALITYKVVGEDSGAYWLETKRETYYDTQITLMLVDLGDRKSLDNVDIKALKQKLDDNSPTEFPSAVLGMMKAIWKPLLEGMLVDWQDKQQETMRVPAGVFQGCYQAYATVSLLGSTKTTHLWAHPAVPMSGTVRSQSTDSTFSMVLLEFGLDGAESEIGI